MIEAVELPATSSTSPSRPARASPYGDVERYLAQLAGHPRECECGRCVLAPQVTVQRVFAIASAWQRQVRATKVRGLR